MAEEIDESSGGSSSTRERLSSLRKLASTSYTRAKQYASERLGRAEMTEYDSELQTLIEQTDKIKGTCERTLNCVEAIIQPDIGTRVEEKLHLTMAKSNLTDHAFHHRTPYTLFATELSRSSSTHEPTTPFGSFLEQCESVQNKIADYEKKFQERAQSEFVAPLRAFLEVDMKNAMRERRTLNFKRIDLDAAKGKVRRLAESEKKKAEERRQAAEAELRVIQHSFDEQVEVTRSTLKKIVEEHSNTYGHLPSFLAIQQQFYSDCAKAFAGIDLSAAGQYKTAYSSTEQSANTFRVHGVTLDREETRQGRMLYDFDADDSHQLSVAAEQEVKVIPIPGDDNYLMAELDGKFGKVPTNYVELL